MRDAERKELKRVINYVIAEKGQYYVNNQNTKNLLNIIARDLGRLLLKKARE